MKTVVKEFKKDLVSIDKINSDKFYGVIIETERCFITADKYLNEYGVRDLNGFTDGGHYTHYSNKKSLSECVKSCMENDCLIFEFDSFKELTTWLNE